MKSTTVISRISWKWGRYPAGVCILLFGFLGTSAALRPGLPIAADFDRQADTVTVRGQVVVVGNEPFTRQRLIEKGGGGYLLSFEGDESINLRRTGPTEVRITGVPYEDTWQGQEIRHLRVVRWEYAGTSER